MRCCICGKEIEGYGNNPYGALDEYGKVIEWKSEDECCNDCNLKVVFGRFILLQNNKKYNTFN